MKKISAINLFKYTCLGCIAGSSVAIATMYVINSIPNTNDDHKTNYTSEVTWDGAYHLGVDDNPDFVASPTQQSIAAALHDQFSLAFPNTNDFIVQITNEFNAVVTALPYSKIYSGSTNVTWDVEQKLNLPSSVLLSPFYTQGNTMYENEDVTEQMVFDKLVSEYSNSLNINQLLLTQRNDVTGEFTVQPKADSTVYNAASQLNAQINVTQSAVLTYTKTIITSGTDSGVPTFKYRGNAVTATYSVVSTPAAPISFSNNKLVYASGVEYSGGLFVITGSYTTGGNTYTASWTIFCQAYKIDNGQFFWNCTNGGSSNNNYKLWKFNKTPYVKRYYFAITYDDGYIDGWVGVTCNSSSPYDCTGLTQYFNWYGSSATFYIGVAANGDAYDFYFGHTSSVWFRPRIAVTATWANSASNITSYGPNISNTASKPSWVKSIEFHA